MLTPEAKLLTPMALKRVVKGYSMLSSSETREDEADVEVCIATKFWGDEDTRDGVPKEDWPSLSGPVPSADAKSPASSSYGEELRKNSLLPVKRCSTKRTGLKESLSQGL